MLCQQAGSSGGWAAECQGDPFCSTGAGAGEATRPGAGAGHTISRLHDSGAVGLQCIYLATQKDLDEACSHSPNSMSNSAPHH